MSAGASGSVIAAMNRSIASLAGTVSRSGFISRSSEFTPPVIYSMDERLKLVFMIEARPPERPERLRVGQPVTITLGPQQ